MAFRASLELNNKEFDVLYSNYEFSRNTDPKGAQRKFLVVKF